MKTTKLQEHRWGNQQTSNHLQQLIKCITVYFVNEVLKCLITSLIQVWVRVVPTPGLPCLANLVKPCLSQEDEFSPSVLTAWKDFVYLTMMRGFVAFLKIIFSFVTHPYISASY